MTEYLEDKFDWNNPELVSVHDELSLWAAPFGQILLDKIKIRQDMIVLDVGSGTGFPLIELSQRLGSSSTVYGIDPWEEGLDRIKSKIKTFNIKNVKLIQGDASEMDFRENFFDLIVSNLGINNFENPQKIFKECFRVAKQGAHIALTSNPKGHMAEFYDIYKKTLKELNMNTNLERLESHINHRLTDLNICDLLETEGFTITSILKSSFSMRFADGSSFLNHYFIKYGFMEGWKGVIPAEESYKVFKKLESNLNLSAKDKNEFTVSIPVIYVEGEKNKGG